MRPTGRLPPPVRKEDGGSLPILPAVLFCHPVSAYGDGILRHIDVMTVENASGIAAEERAIGAGGGSHAVRLGRKQPVILTRTYGWLDEYEPVGCFADIGAPE